MVFPSVPECAAAAAAGSEGLSCKRMNGYCGEQHLITQTPVGFGGGRVGISPPNLLLTPLRSAEALLKILHFAASGNNCSFNSKGRGNLSEIAQDRGASLRRRTGG